jgi:hypothetical protein
VQDGPNVLWWTWTGTRIQRTLCGLGVLLAGLRVEDEELMLSFEKTTVSEVRRAYRSFLNQSIDPEALAARFANLEREKYDRFLPLHLQARSFAKQYLDLPGALGLIREL